MLGVHEGQSMLRKEYTVKEFLSENKELTFDTAKYGGMAGRTPKVYG